MATCEIPIQNKLQPLIGEFADNHCCLEILRFLGSYPDARFSERVIISVVSKLNGRKEHLKGALSRLITKSILSSHIENHVPLYSLTKEESPRSLALALAKLDWHQWQRVLGQIYPSYPSREQRGNPQISLRVSLEPIYKSYATIQRQDS